MVTRDHCKQPIAPGQVQTVCDVRRGLFAFLCPPCADALRAEIAQEKAQGREPQEGGDADGR